MSEASPLGHPLRVLGIETSSTRGSVALAWGDEIACERFHASESQHAERMLGLLEEALQQAGWQKDHIERVAVGVGPGAFTGIRVGIALAEGLALGLGVPLVGVCSLRAMAYQVPASDPRLRVVVRDARRGEYFLAAYDGRGEERLAPLPVPQEQAAAFVERELGTESLVIVGESLPGLPHAEAGILADAPASAVARLGLRCDPKVDRAIPQYVRGPGADKPHLPPSPLEMPRV